MLSVIEFNRNHDTAYIRLHPDRGEPVRVARSIRVADDIVLDLDAEEKLIGIELLNASARLNVDEITNRATEVIVGVKEAAALIGVEKPNFLRDYAAKPEFPKPIAELASGRFWLRTDVERYFATYKTKGQEQRPQFQIGDLVTLRADSTAVLAVIEVIPGSIEPRYRVLQQNAMAVYYESQLQRASAPVEQHTTVGVQELHAHLTSLQILSPSTTNLFSLRAGRVQFVPYQYRPVLKLIRADQPRLLIADEVGVGKTIEAGLILRELRARMDISSVLIICPKALVAERKWFTEMKRFDEEFIALDGPRLRQCIEETDLEGEWPSQFNKAILPFSLIDSQLIFGNGNKLKRGQGLLSLNPPPKFDLVIVDEAHNIRNSETLLHQGIRYFCDNAHALLLLSATPVQLGRNDLFTLLNVLRPDLIIDEASFAQMAEPNEYINAAVRHCRKAHTNWQADASASLLQAARTEWGRLFLKSAPSFNQSIERLKTNHLDAAQRVGLTRSIEELYTFSPLINRTRRRDIGTFTTRKPETITIDFTPDQQRLHNDLLEVVARILIRCHGMQNIKFMMTTIRRQAASCLYGLRPFLSDILNGKVDRLEVLEASDAIDDANLDGITEIKGDIEALLDRASNLDPHDPKVEAFVTVLQNKNARVNNKALVFSTFRHTLSYLYGHVRQARLRVGLIHGDIPDEERAVLRRQFALPREAPEAIDVLLSSEVGCEGLDFQFCDFLINYDLPWNPMRVEQRIGRIDRYGQQSETVAIVNFITPGTVDADIYDRCLSRIGVFEHAIGGNEEILGAITKELHDIATSFELNPEERAARLQQLADNRIRQIQEEEDLETRQADLLGLDIPAKTWRDELKAAETFWLSSAAIQRSVTTYLTLRLRGGGDYLLGDKPLKTLRLNQDARRELLADYRNLPRSTEPLAREWEKWLKGSQPTFSITFDQETATANPKCVYLSVVHPLVRQAARFLEITEPKYCSLSAQSQDIPPGEYFFALYRWTKRGIKHDEELVAVSTETTLERFLLELLQIAKDHASLPLPDPHDCDALDARHHSKWSEAQLSYRKQNQQIAAHRMQSLTVSHRTRCKAIEDQITRAGNDKIRVMKESELVRANTDFTHRMAELTDSANTADIRTTPVVFGTMKITTETT